MGLPNPRILYTEDTFFLYTKIVPVMETLLNANVTHTIDNQEAEDWFRAGKRFDAYVFDDSAVSGGGHGIRLSMEVAQTLASEGRGGIVISACSSNAEILTGSDRTPYTIADLRQNQIEFWYKHTEIFKMLAWLGVCLKEESLITRESWLTSVGEQTGYDTFGTGNEVEKKLRFMADDLNKSLKGVYYKILMPDFFRLIREGKYADEAIKEMLPAGKKGKEK